MDHRAKIITHGDTYTMYMTKHNQKLPDESKASHVTSDYFEQFNKTEKLVSDYDGVNPNRKNVWISLDKMFEKPKLSFDRDLMENRVYRLAKRALAPALHAHVRIHLN